MKRTPSKSIIAALIGAASFASLAVAAPVEFGTPTVISGDSDVSTAGTRERAFNLGRFNTTTVINGVTFNPFAVAEFNGTSSITIGSTTIDSSPSFVRGQGKFGGGTGLSVALRSLLDQAVFNSAAGTDLVLTLNGLTIGHTYLVQFFAQDSRAAGSGASIKLHSGGSATVLDYNDTEMAGGHGQFVIGYFTADATSQAFTFLPSATAILNGFQLRTVAVPEPSAGMLLAVAGGIIGCALRFRRKS